MKTLCLSMLGLIVAMAGCGQVDDGLPKTVNASGVVMCDGKPLDGATIVLMQENGTNFARGFTDGSGRFSLDAFETKKGAVPGEYKVTVSKTVTVDKATPKPAKALAEDAEHAAAGGEEMANASWVNDLPEKYNNPATSGLSVTIPESGISDIKLEVSRN